MILLELLLRTARCYGHAPRVEHAWGGAEAEAVAAPFVLRRVSSGRGVDLLRAVQLLAELRTKDRGLVGHLLRSRCARRAHDPQRRPLLIVHRIHGLPIGGVGGLEGDVWAASDVELSTILHLRLILELLHSR